jgi:hypothetical protein
MKVQRLVVSAALAFALVLVTVGCEQQPPEPSDYAKIAAVQAPTLVTRGVQFAVAVYAEDLASPEYAVIARDDLAPDGIEFHGTTCNAVNGGPSADGNWCEYSHNGNTTRSITQSTYRYVWTGAKGVSFSLRFCASSFTNPVDPYPYGGDCVTRHVTVAP